VGSPPLGAQYLYRAVETQWATFANLEGCLVQWEEEGGLGSGNLILVPFQGLSWVFLRLIYGLAGEVRDHGTAGSVQSWVEAR